MQFLVAGDQIPRAGFTTHLAVQTRFEIDHILGSDVLAQ
jgi:hypothetical protein